jgi:membrane AbrB-like protein
VNLRTALIDPVQSWVRAFAPGRFHYGRFALAMALAVAGGALFAMLRLPLPWMLGPVAVLTLASLAGLPVATPSVVRSPMTMLLGLLLGAAFTPALFTQASQWLVTIVGLVVFIIASGAACTWYFRKVGGFDPTTAYFSGMPGGLIEMVLFGGERGGDAPSIALVQSARILLVVSIVPFLVELIEGVTLGARGIAGPPIATLSWSDGFWLLVSAFGGALFAHIVRLPAKPLLGPMIVGGALHITGVTSAAPPMEVVLVAQIVLGAAIGCSFAGVERQRVLRVLLLSLGATVVLLSVTLVFAFVFARLSGYSLVLLLLAYSPGGLAEMGLIALTMHLDIAFVAAHHTVRVLLVLLAATPAFALMSGRSKEAPAE